MEIAYSPVAGNKEGDAKVLKPLKQTKWATEPDCFDSCIYPVCDSADDYNKVANHVGAPPTDCCTIYMARIFHHCGGVCVMYNMAADVKQKYERLHNLEPQEIPCWAALCPEITWRQVVRDHRIRVGGRMEPMEPAAKRMARG